MLIVDKVKKTFKSSSRTVTVLNGISFRIDNGKFVVIKGPSGAGKTTLLLTIGALLSPDEGEIILADQNPYKLSSDERSAFRAQNIGFVFQQFYLMPYLNVLENILLPVVITNDKDKSKLYLRARMLIDEFGLSHRVYHLPEQLSVGEKQRMALIRALIRQPKLILADEPTGNLDENNATLVISKLRKFAEQGAIVILATHEKHILEYADMQISLPQ